MSQSISPEQLAHYRASAQKREQERTKSHQQRQQQGWRVARQATQILKQEFGAKRIVLFGSMLHLKRIHGESDIDLAVEGLLDSQYLQAVAHLLDISDFSVDLVQIEHTTPSIRAVINQEGVEL